MIIDRYSNQQKQLKDAHAKLQKRSSKGLQTLVNKRTKRQQLNKSNSSESETCRLLRRELQRAQQNISVQ